VARQECDVTTPSAQELGAIASNTKHFATAFIVLLIASLSSVALHGFDYPYLNNTIHVPIVLDYARSAEGPADLFTRSLDRFVSSFWVALSYVATESNIYALFLGIHLAVRLLFGFLIWRIACLLGGDKPVTLALACFLLFFDSFLGGSLVGHNDFLAPYLTQSEVVIPIILASWWLTLRNRYLGAAGLLGLAFNVNAFIAIWSSLAAGLAMIVDRRQHATFAVLRTAVLMTAVFAAVASPTIIWILSALGDVRPHPDFGFGQYLRERFPYHTFIDVQVPETITSLLFFAAGMAALAHIGGSWTSRQRSVVWSLLCGLMAVFVFGMILPYVSDERLLLVLFPLRMDTYIVLLIGIAVVAWAAKAYAGDDARQLPYAMIGLFSLVNSNVALLLLSVIGAANRPVRLRTPRSWLLGLWIAVAAAHLIFGRPVALSAEPPALAAFTLVLQGAIVAFFLARRENAIAESFIFVSVCALGVYPSLDGLLATALVAGVYAAALLYACGLRPRPILALTAPVLLAIGALPSAVRVSLLVVVMAMPVAARYAVPFLSTRAFRRGGINTGVAYAVLAVLVVLGAADMARRGGLSRNPEQARLHSEAQLWARQNIPPHETLLAVGAENFSTLSRRPVWVDWKWGNTILWAPELYATWSSRWEEVRSIQSLADAQALADREDIDYIVIKKSRVPVTDLPAHCILFENDVYAIVTTCLADLKSPASANATSARP